ncbi:hypothetical protein [Xylanibacter rodentium]|uniref:hypothetical protein n=1 Tax=Xylanibacter rodentium TaxID=2736289 RepID=UPI002557E53A|nr:hypothetical protein [Xylanibacter rodentium]
MQKDTVFRDFAACYDIMERSVSNAGLLSEWNVYAVTAMTVHWSWYGFQKTTDQFEAPVIGCNILFDVYC